MNRPADIPQYIWDLAGKTAHPNGIHEAIARVIMAVVVPMVKQLTWTNNGFWYARSDVTSREYAIYSEEGRYWVVIRGELLDFSTADDAKRYAQTDHASLISSALLVPIEVRFPASAASAILEVSEENLEHLFVHAQEGLVAMAAAGNSQGSISPGGANQAPTAHAVSWENRKARELEIVRDYELGNLTPLGVANYLRRVGFNSRYSTDRANALAKGVAS